MMHTSAKAALGTYTNLAAECKVLPNDSEYIENTYNTIQKKVPDPADTFFT